MSIESLRNSLASIEAAVAVLFHHPEPSVSSTGQTIGLHMRDAKIALDDIANELNKVEADTNDNQSAYAATADKPLQ